MKGEEMQGAWLKVGIVASLTGQFHGQGSQALEGAAAWVRDVNAGGGIFVGDHGGELPVQLKHYDDESKAQVAREMTEKLILDDRVDLLMGPYSSVLTLAAAPVAERLQRVLWNHGGASDQIYNQGFRWVVGVLTPASRYLLGVIDLVKERDPGARRVAILHSGRGTFPEAVALGVESYAAQEGFQIVFKGQYHSPAADFSSLLGVMKEREPDIVLGVGRIQDDLLLARQIVQRRVRAKSIALVAAGIGQFEEALGSWAAGFIGPSQWEPRASHTPDYGPSAQNLAKIFHPEHRAGLLADLGVPATNLLSRVEEVSRPGGGDYAMAQAYAAGLIAQKCVEEAGTLDNRALRAVADRLDFATFYGRFKLDPATGCQIGRSVVIVQWQGDKKVIVWPKEQSQGDLLYPSHDRP